MREILGTILERTGRGEAVALASIVTARGSLPMARRARMLVLSDGSQTGTVGGGCLEADVHALARLVMRGGKGLLGRFTLTEAKAGAEGLNCGGSVEILIEAFGPGPTPHHEVLRHALSCLEAGEETVLATLAVLQPAGEPDEAAALPATIAGKGLVGWKGVRAGSGAMRPDSPLAAHAAEEALSILGQDRSVFRDLPAGLGPEGGRLFLETLDHPPTLYLFGGGHVSLAVARVARTAGFRIVVVDDRPAFADPDRFPEAERTLVMTLHDAVGRLPIDRRSYVVAVTRGHQHDEPVIEQAIRTPAAYIGMIGSRRKVALMWRRLRERGVSEVDLARVNAPIGLPIGGDSPGEIAVSIVAQLIQVRRQGRR